MSKSSKTSIADLLARARAIRAAEIISKRDEEEKKIAQSKEAFAGIELTNIPIPDGVSENWTWHEKQLDAIKLAKAGKPFVMLGPAGTGKTTVMNAIGKMLIQEEIVSPLEESTKFLTSGSPGLVTIAYTRRATNNIRSKMPRDLQNNCLTFHKLMEYEPMYYDTIDPETGKMRTTMRFEPMRNRGNPLPSSVGCIAIEESSMFSVEFQETLEQGLRHKPMFIYLGDIQQLPPVYGSAILGFKMLELPVIELTHVYRQALKSPIIRLAHRILSGIGVHQNEAISMATSNYWTEKFPDEFTKEEAEKASNQLKIRFFPKKVHWEPALYATANALKFAIDEGTYDVDQDIILIPFNGGEGSTNQFGSIELNKHIAQHVSKKNNEIVWEILAGFKKQYLAVGDRVMYDKEDAIITHIAKNQAYLGKRTQNESMHLDRWGANQDPNHVKVRGSGGLEEMDAAGIEALMLAASKADSEDRVQEASHVVTLEFRDGGEIKLNTAGQINNLSLAYAMTVHKAQGCEWRKVYLILHHTHNQMVFRELLYTAVTRAREELTILCEPDTLVNGLKKQRIQGNTLEEKAEYFKGKRNEKEKEKEKDGVLFSNSEIQKPKIFSVSDLLNEGIKDVTIGYFNTWWQKAEDIWPALKSYSRPTLKFDIRSSRILGQAQYRRNSMRLNPIYITNDDLEMHEEVWNTTIPHEICHFIAWHLFKEPQHGERWKFCMEKMGIPPERLYMGTLPPYAKTKMKYAEELLMKYNVKDDEDKEIEE